MLEGLPTDNPNTLEKYINAKFSQLPELLGGNHSTAACIEVKDAHTVEDADGATTFCCPAGSKITPHTLPKFLHRYTHYILSPLPLEETKKSPYLRSALLTYARSLNDQAKFVKAANLTDNLQKARQGLEGFLRTATDSKGNLYFKAKENCWPHSHADLQRAVYSKQGIQTAVANMIAEEFSSQKSAFKIAVNCPEEIFNLMLEISQIQQNTVKTNKVSKKPGGKTKGKEPAAAISSARYFREFTLNFCTLANLKLALEQVRSALLTHRGKAGVFGKFAQSFQMQTSYNRMLNAIVEDLSNKENPCTTFVAKIGQPNKEGFYEEESFTKVCKCIITCTYCLGLLEQVGIFAKSLLGHLVQEKEEPTTCRLGRKGVATIPQRFEKKRRPKLPRYTFFPFLTMDLIICSTFLGYSVQCRPTREELPHNLGG